MSFPAIMVRDGSAPRQWVLSAEDADEVFDRLACLAVAIGCWVQPKNMRARVASKRAVPIIVDQWLTEPSDVPLMAAVGLLSLDIERDDWRAAYLELDVSHSISPKCADDLAEVLARVGNPAGRKPCDHLFIRTTKAIPCPAGFRCSPEGVWMVRRNSDRPIPPAIVSERGSWLSRLKGSLDFRSVLPRMDGSL